MATSQSNVRGKFSVRSVQFHNYNAVPLIMHTKVRWFSYQWMAHTESQLHLLFGILSHCSSDDETHDLTYPESGTEEDYVSPTFVRSNRIF